MTPPPVAKLVITGWYRALPVDKKSQLSLALLSTVFGIISGVTGTLYDSRVLKIISVLFTVLGGLTTIVCATVKEPGSRPTSSLPLTYPVASDVASHDQTPLSPIRNLGEAVNDVFGRPSHPGEHHSTLNLDSTVTDRGFVSAVDYRSHAPNEVKRRKRATAAQLKIFEGIFERDTKPNAAFLNELAAKLDLTPRAVQLWFQSRRASEKSKSKIALMTKSSAQDTSPSPPTLEGEGAIDTQPEAKQHASKLVDTPSQDSNTFRISPQLQSSPPMPMESSPSRALGLGDEAGAAEGWMRDEA